MMKNQIKLIAALTIGVTFASSAGIAEAGRPFSRFSSSTSRSSQNYRSKNYSSLNHSAKNYSSGTQHASSATSYANSILQSPERMEKVYGPSILQPAEQLTAKRAVSQP